MNEEQYQGGRVFVEQTISGWEITHEPKNGGRYGVDWQARKTQAIRKAMERAEQFGAKVFIEHPTTV